VVLLAIVGVVIVLGIGGCAVLSVVVNDSVDEASNTLKEGLRKAQNRNSITDEQAKSLDVGDDRNEIVRRFGPPAFGPAKEPVLPADVRDCISWHMRDGRIGSTWELCFRAGKLVEKQSDLSPSPRRRRPPRKAVPSQEQ